MNNDITLWENPYIGVITTILLNDKVGIFSHRNTIIHSSITLIARLSGYSNNFLTTLVYLVF